MEGNQVLSEEPTNTVQGGERSDRNAVGRSNFSSQNQPSLLGLLTLWTESFARNSRTGPS